MANESDTTKTLEMTFMPNTIEHLGARLYSTIPPVVAELVANSLDADSKVVKIELFDEEDKVIVVDDNGHGMSFSDINYKFLRIGRNRRADNAENGDTSPEGRPVIGKKGLGKLSFFGIARIIEVSTIQDELRNTFILDWEDIVGGDDNDQPLKNYNPTIVEENFPVEGLPNGTRITLRNIQRSSSFDVESLANSLARFFIFEEDVRITIQRNGGEEILLTNERRYSLLDTEFEWVVPDDIEADYDYDKKDCVIGKIFTTVKPISPNTSLRGITLFSRKKLVNLPEFYSDSTSSHIYSYLSGWLEVDFIDELDEDVIETNRQSLNWDHPSIAPLREYLRFVIRSIERSWREQRKQAQDEKLTERTEIDVAKWRENTPAEIQVNLEPLLESLRKDSELPEKDEDAIKGIEQLYKLVPPYTYYQWRYLNPRLSDIVFEYYKHENYYSAVFEGAKDYINAVKEKTGSNLSDHALIENVFALKRPKLSVVDGYFQSNGQQFDYETLKNITEGHRLLALAMWQAFRCPVAHETVKELKYSDIFSEKDCLDALSLLSHLYRRLETSTLLT